MLARDKCILNVIEVEQAIDDTTLFIKYLVKLTDMSSIVILNLFL